MRHFKKWVLGSRFFRIFPPHNVSSRAASYKCPSFINSITVYDLKFQRKMIPSRQLHVTRWIKLRNFSRVLELHLTRIPRISNISAIFLLTSDVTFSNRTKIRISVSIAKEILIFTPGDNFHKIYFMQCHDNSYLVTINFLN